MTEGWGQASDWD